MKLIAVRTARLISSVSLEELNPKGLSVYPSLIEGLVNKYGFQGYPKQYEELDEAKGIKFEDGEWNGIAINRVSIFTDGIIVDTRSSTDDSLAMFNEAMQWASDTIGLTYEPSMISEQLFVSEVVITSDVSLNNINPALQMFCEKLSNKINSYTGRKANYKLVGAFFDYDNSQDKIPIASFRIERLEGAKFKSNKYYASAPLPTNEHLSLLEEFEVILSTS